MHLFSQYSFNTNNMVTRYAPLVNILQEIDLFPARLPFYVICLSSFTDIMYVIIGCVDVMYVNCVLDASLYKWDENILVVSAHRWTTNQMANYPVTKCITDHRVST